MFVKCKQCGTEFVAMKDSQADKEKLCTGCFTENQLCPPKANTKS